MRCCTRSTATGSRRCDSTVLRAAQLCWQATIPKGDLYAATGSGRWAVQHGPAGREVLRHHPGASTGLCR